MEVQVSIDKRSLNQAIRDIEKYAKKVSSPAKKRAINRKAGNHVKKVMKVFVIKSVPKVVKFYKNGEVLAEIYRGDLNRSISTFSKEQLAGQNSLSLRKDPSIYVGPKRVKKTGGTFKGRRTWGYQMFWVEFGTANQPARPYFRPAVSISKGRVKSILIEGYKKLANDV